MSDGQGVLVQIVFDPYSVIALGPDKHGVGDTGQYSTARRLVERLKAGDERISIPLTIVVRKRSLLLGFEDILSWPTNLVDYQDASPRASLQKLLGIPLSEDITSERLVGWGIRSASDLPVADVRPGEVSEEWLIDQILKRVTKSNVWSSSTMSGHQDWMTQWFGFLLTQEMEWFQQDSVLRKRVLRRIQRWREQSATDEERRLGDLLCQAMLEGMAGQLAHQVAARALLQSYGRGDRKLIVTNLNGALVGPWIPRNKLTAGARKLIERIVLTLYEAGQLDELIHALDPVIRQHLLEWDGEASIAQLIQQVSGYIPAEYYFVVERFCDAVVTQHPSGEIDVTRFHASLREIEERFRRLLARAEFVEDRQGWLGRLLELAALLRELVTISANSFSDWLELLRLLLHGERIVQELQKVRTSAEERALAHLSQQFDDSCRELNDAYSIWLVESFRDCLRADVREGTPMVTQVTRLGRDLGKAERAIILVVDGLRWDWWEHLAEQFAARGYHVSSDIQAGLAMLPTTTGISRRAALGGFPLNELVNFVDDIYGVEIAPEEEAKLAARALGYAGDVDTIRTHEKNQRIRYLKDRYVCVNGDSVDFRQALELPARHYVLVSTAIDTIIHSQSEQALVERNVRAQLDRVCTQILDEVDRAEHIDKHALKIIVTADHGCVNARYGKQVSLPAALSKYVEDSMSLERHGRVALLCAAPSDQGVPEMRKQLENFYSDNAEDWHVIWGQDAEDWGLPSIDKRGDYVLCWLLPRRLDYLARGRGAYVHGGFSLFETIVPMAQLRHGKERPVVAPRLFFAGGLDSLQKGRETTVRLLITNDNDVPLTDQRLTLPELAVSNLPLPDVRPKDSASMSITGTPTVSGRSRLHIDIRYRVGLSRIRHLEVVREVEIQMSHEERMRMETQRDLF